MSRGRQRIAGAALLVLLACLLGVPRASAQVPSGPAAPVGGPEAPVAGATLDPPPVPAGSIGTPNAGPPAAAPAGPDLGAADRGPPAPPAPPRPPSASARIERAWSAPGSIEERTQRVRREADALGLAELDPLARAVLTHGSERDASARAFAAVWLAPGLPAAQMALAEASWRAGRGAVTAAIAAGRALAALFRHFESRLWLEATVASLVFAATAAAGLLFIAGRGLAALPRAAHDLGDRIEPSMPPVARAALGAVVVLAPLALGEGLLGAALVLFAIAFTYADDRERRALALAAALVALAQGPLAQLAGRRLEVLDADPIARAAAATGPGLLDAVDAVRLERAASGDPLALHALALRARRDGDLETARARFEALLAIEPRDPVALNNAANVHLDLGDTAGAIERYRRAGELLRTAPIWFNLSQAHARAIDMDAHAAALAVAQAIDAAATGELSQRLAGGRPDFVVELSIPATRVRERMLGGGGAAAAALRAYVAPGAIGRAAWLAPVLFAALALAAGLLRRGFEPARSCAECGARLCARCGEAGAAGLCASCGKSRFEARHLGPWEAARGEPAPWRVRLARAARALGRALPGLAGPTPARPLVALGALVAGSGALAFALGLGGVVPDPASVGAAGPLALALAAGALVALAAALGAAAGAAEERH